MTLPIAGCEAEGNFSKLSTINNEFVYRKWFCKIVIIWIEDQGVCR
jgi:hypothetical protein